MASTGTSSQVELYYFLVLIALVLILRVRRTLNGQRYSDRIFILPTLYALILLSFIVTLTIEEILIAVILAVVAIPLGLRVSENPEFFFRNNDLFFKRSVVLTIIWLGGFIVRVFLEIFYSTGNNLINFIITGLLAFTLGLIIGERSTLYAVLGGFGGLIGKPTPTASMTVSISGTGASSTYDVTFTSVSSNISLNNTQLKLTTSSGSTSVYSFTYHAGGSYYGASTSFASVSGSGAYLTFSTVITLTPGSSLSAIYIVDTQTGGVIASQTNL